MDSNGDGNHNDSEHQPVHIDIAKIIASLNAEKDNVHIDIANVNAEEANVDAKEEDVDTEQISNIVELVEDTTLYSLSRH